MQFRTGKAICALSAVNILLTCGCTQMTGTGQPDSGSDGNSNSQPTGAVTITYLQNDGVLISDGTSKILIDALIDETVGPPEPAGLISDWLRLDAAELNRLKAAEAPYDDVDVFLVTHVHPDHFCPDAINTYLSNNATVMVVGPPQVTGGLAGPQIVSSNPARGSSETMTISGVQIEILHLRHFDAYGFDFSDVENLGYLITLGGQKILHLGDVDLTNENLQDFGLADKGIDVVLIPTFNTEAHLTTAHRDALMDQVRPANVIALHLLSGEIDTISQQVNALYPGATIFTQPLQSMTLP